MSADPNQSWHQMSAEAALDACQSSIDGLDSLQAQQRLSRHGPNQLPPPPRKSAWLRFALQFHNVLIYVLLFSASVTLLLGHPVDSAVILGVVVINAIIGFVQEGKAEAALESIRQMLSLTAVALRDGHRAEIAAEQLVPGDIVLLASGDKVPADLRLLSARNLRIEEATLTGESVPSEKSIDPVVAEATIGDRACMAYSGTMVTYGQGRGVVVATGTHTELGRISHMLEQVETLSTPLMRQMSGFARWLSAGILLLASAIFLFGHFVQGYAMHEMFLAAVGVAVAAIPEGLPAIMTITLALGVQRMARRNAIIRQLPAVETLGAVTVICTDKTGTLTRNEMTVTRIVTASGLLEIGGTGYAPQGGFMLAGRELAPETRPELLELARAGLLCNDARLVQEQDGDVRWRPEGDPTEVALITLAIKAGFDPQLLQKSLPRSDVIPFESEHRFMATLHHDHQGHGFIFLKGAPERVLALCRSQREASEDRPLQPAWWQARMDELAVQGLRLLAIAFRTAGSNQRELRFSDVGHGFTLLGVVGIIDPPREEAIAAVQQCQEASIRVKMITGDHVATARAIAAQLGLKGQTAISGDALEGMDERSLRDMVRNTDVFARASPEHKLRLVQAMQANGEIAAMTGDGVNDAPALKRADVGVAMGQKGTEAAKEAAKVVLADDNFASIAHAVEEGRTVYDNLKKAILFILPTNIGEAMIIVTAIALGLTLPITAVQILWVNMVTAVTLALALAFEPAENDVMRRPPRDPSKPLLSGFLVWRIAFVSVLLVIGAIGLFLLETGRGHSVEAARTSAVNALVMVQMFYLFNSRQLLASVLNRAGLLGNPVVWYAIGLLLILQILFTHAPFMHTLFGTAALDAQSWLLVVAVGAAIFSLVEVEKAVVRRLRRDKSR
jgi:magnesium-transporting ATPase (P-type)